MFTALIQMALLIACGTLWKSYAPAHISAMAHRRALTDLVFYLLLPALVLNIIWQVPLSYDSIKVSFLAASGISTGVIAMWLVIKYLKASRKQTGALLLAASFPNGTYLGLPVLDQVVGSHTRAIILNYDLLACTPILMSLGILMSNYYGDSHSRVNPLRELMRIPPLWAVTLGIILNISGVPQPEIIDASLSTLAGGVVPLMLIVLGMSIRWQSLRLRFMPLLIPVAAISLILVPLSVLGLSYAVGLDTNMIIPVALISAMPTMVFGIVICERYHLDTDLYAAAATFTTILSLISLPVWFALLS